MSPSAVAAPITSTSTIAEGTRLFSADDARRLHVDHLVQALDVQPRRRLRRLGVERLPRQGPQPALEPDSVAIARFAAGCRAPNARGEARVCVLLEQRQRTAPHGLTAASARAGRRYRSRWHRSTTAARRESYRPTAIARPNARTSPTRVSSAAWTTPNGSRNVSRGGSGPAGHEPDQRRPEHDSREQERQLPAIE